MLRIPDEILEATRLTRAGRLAEATAAIQRALRRAPPPAPVERKPDECPPIEGEYRVMDVDAPVIAALKADAERQARFIEGSFTNHAGTRRYKLYIPSTYRDKAVPMVVMLHGCKQNPDDFAAGTRMNEAAESAGCLVLYPAQANRANPSRCWNWFKRSDQQRQDGEPALIAGMTQFVMNTYCVDKRRVNVAGLSAGGAMAAVMAQTHPELYAAVCVHSGIAYAIAQDLPSALRAMRGPVSPGTATASAFAPPIPTIVFHGDGDKVVHPSNADHVVAQSTGNRRHDGGNAESSNDVTVTVTRGRVPGGHAYTCERHRDTSGRVVLENWIIHEGGHAWSGGSANGSFTDPRGPDATREMMRFFEANPKVG